MPAETFRIKAEAAGHIDELMLVAEYDGYKSDVGNKHENDFAEDGFNYWTAFFEDSDGGYYRIKISVGLSGDSKTVYNVNDIKERSPFPPTALPQSGALMEAGASSASPETEAPGTSYASSVTQNTPDVKNSIRNRNETDTQSALRREAEETVRAVMEAIRKTCRRRGLPLWRRACAKPGKRRWRTR